MNPEAKKTFVKSEGSKSVPFTINCENIFPDIEIATKTVTINTNKM